MVNERQTHEKLSTKRKVLEILRAANSPVSGEQIAERIGVSRVSVWKAIQALQGAGYGIVPTRAGYEIAADLRDSIFPWEFAENECKFLHFARTESTMIEARRIAESGSLETGAMQVVTADFQSGGMGRQNRKWATTEGSLACTLVTQSVLPLAQSHRVTMAAQVALAKVLSELAKRKFYVRWPNDIWTENGKVAGVLDELGASGGVTRWVNVGLGVNISAKPRLAQTDVAGAGVSRRELLEKFCAEFARQNKSACSQCGGLAREWNSLCLDCGKTVGVAGSDGAFVFRGISEMGFALLQSRADFSERTLVPGAGRLKKSR